MIKCEIDTKKGSKELELKGGFASQLVEVEELLRAIRKSFEGSHEEELNGLLDKAVENSKLSPKESIFRQIEEAPIPTCLRDFLRNVIEKAEKKDEE